jgi:small-conductance mechanosensitive channel
MKKFSYKIDFEYFLSEDALLQCALLLISLLLGMALRTVVQRYDKTHQNVKNPLKILAIVPFIEPLVSTVLIAVFSTVLEQSGIAPKILSPAQQLVFGWIAVISIRRVTESQAATWFSGLIILPVTLMHVVGIWGYLVKYLNSLSFAVGDSTVTLYRFLSTLVALVALLWLAKSLTHSFETRLKKTKTVRASTRALIIKITQIFSYIVIFLFTLDSVGVDLSVLAVFGGALGVGLGFGLQKVASNFISGIILLFEKSIEPDDLIELSDGTTGTVKHTGARYTLLETIDGREILVPNEDFIVQRVTNWTYSNKIARVEIAVGVAYDSDFNKVKEILLTAARQHPLCSKKTKPNAFLRTFGDSAANFVLYFWIDDVTNGRLEPQSDVMLAIWKRFQEDGIQIPYPQREYRVRVTNTPNEDAPPDLMGQILKTPHNKTEPKA